MNALKKVNAHGEACAIYVAKNQKEAMQFVNCIEIGNPSSFTSMRSISVKLFYSKIHISLLQGV